MSVPSLHRSRVLLCLACIAFALHQWGGLKERKMTSEI